VVSIQKGTQGDSGKVLQPLAPENGFGRHFMGEVAEKASGIEDIEIKVEHVERFNGDNSWTFDSLNSAYYSELSKK
jgi:hypothetical protein